MTAYPSRADLEECQRYVDCTLDDKEVVVTWERVSRRYDGAVICVWHRGEHFDAENFSATALKQLADQCTADDEQEMAA